MGDFRIPRCHYQYYLLIFGIVQLLTLSLMSEAFAERLVVSLSNQKVEITSTYTGAELAVYGVVEKDGQTSGRATDYMIVITVLGPTRNYIVREKMQLGPAWINRKQHQFRDRPSYVGVLSSQPLSTIIDRVFTQRYDVNLGLDFSVARFEERKNLSPRVKSYLDALIRLESNAGRYYQNESGVRFFKYVDESGDESQTASSLFDAKVSLPATVMTGTYTLEIALFAAGSLLDRKRTFFEVQKSGFEAAILDYVHHHSFFYGFGLCILALFFGWLASVIFRRD